jgi:WD40 repeat protein
MSTQKRFSIALLLVVFVMIGFNGQIQTRADVLLQTQAATPSGIRPIITAQNVGSLVEIARLCTVKHGGYCGPVVGGWSPDSKFLAVAGEEGVYLFDVNNLEQPLKQIKLPFQHGGDVIFSSDWSLLAIIYSDWSAEVWDVALGKLKYKVPLPGLNIGWLTFSSNSHLMATWSNDYIVRLWDVKTLRQFFIWQNDDPIFTFSPDNQLFAIEQPRSIQLWNLPAGTHIADLKFEDHPQPIISDLSFSPDSQLLVVSSIYSTTVWNTRTFEKQFEFDMDFKYDWALGATFSPDGKLLACIGRERIYLWDMITGKQVTLIDGLGLDRVGAQFNVDSSLLISTDRYFDPSYESEDPYVRFWDSHTGKNLGAFRNEENPLLSPDGTLLVTSDFSDNRPLIIRAVR